MAHIAAAPQRRNVALWAFVFMGAGLLSILPLSVFNPTFSNGSHSASLAFDRSRIAYFEFDTNADTLWLADPSAPAQRTKLFSVAHAPDYGVVPSLSPDSRRAAYAVLPPETPGPGPDAPAQLWVASLTGSRPHLLTGHADLLVPAVWSPDSGSLVFRRSDASTGSLISIAAEGGAERVLVTSTAGLFPVAFAPDGSSLFYAVLNDAGSTLRRVDVASGADSAVAMLSDGLTRDWTLSPDGRRFAYLEISLSGQSATARAFVLDLATRERTAAGAANTDAFSPAWDAGGALIVGQLATGARSTPATVVANGSASTLTPPRRGFDVPLAASADSGTAVISFDGNSLLNPGRATLVVVDPQGVRREIATNEVTFLGWINP